MKDSVLYSEIYVFLQWAIRLQFATGLESKEALFFQLQAFKVCNFVDFDQFDRGSNPKIQIHQTGRFRGAEVENLLD